MMEPREGFPLLIYTHGNGTTRAELCDTCRTESMTTQGLREATHLGSYVQNQACLHTPGAGLGLKRLNTPGSTRETRRTHETATISHTSANDYLRRMVQHGASLDSPGKTTTLRTGRKGLRFARDAQDVAASIPETKNAPLA